MSSIGEMIKEAREKRCLSQTDLAVMVEVGLLHIRKLEEGVIPPSDAMCVKLAQALPLEARDLQTMAVAVREGIDLAALITARTPEEKKFLAAAQKLTAQGKVNLVGQVIEAMEDEEAHNFKRRMRQTS